MHTEISVAGVPWPMYKLLALIVGALVLVSALVLVMVGVITASAGPAVLTAAGAATVVWAIGAARG